MASMSHAATEGMDWSGGVWVRGCFMSLAAEGLSCAVDVARPYCIPHEVDVIIAYAIGFEHVSMSFKALSEVVNGEFPFVQESVERGCVVGFRGLPVVLDEAEVCT